MPRPKLALQKKKVNKITFRDPLKIEAKKEAPSQIDHPSSEIVMGNRQGDGTGRFRQALEALLRLDLLRVRQAVGLVGVIAQQILQLAAVALGDGLRAEVLPPVLESLLFAERGRDAHGPLNDAVDDDLPRNERSSTATHGDRKVHHGKLNR